MRRVAVVAAMVLTVFAPTALAGVRVVSDLIGAGEATAVVFTAPRTVSAADDKHWYAVTVRRWPRLSGRHRCHDAYRFAGLDRDVRKGERVRLRIPHSRLRWCTGIYQGAVQIWELDYSTCEPGDKCNPEPTLADQVGRFSFRVR